MKEEAVDEMAADKDESEIKALWVTFVGTSTFHGLHYLFDALSRLRKLAWALLLLAAFTVFVRQILYGYTKLQKHEVFITTEFKPNVELTFPAVTVCNVNMMKKSHLLKTEAQTYLDGTDWRHPNMRQLYKAYNKSYNLEKAVQDYGHVYSDMIKKCQFIGQACDKVFEIRTFIDAKNGLCHTLNSGKNMTIYKTGASYSLSLLLDAQPEEYYGRFSREGTGFIIVIHNQSVSPNPEYNGITVSPGFNTQFKLEERRVMRQPFPYSSKCSSEVTDGYILTRERCLLRCRVEKLAEELQCRVIGTPPEMYPDMRLCGAKEMVENISRIMTELKEERDCKCSPPCDVTTYDAQISSTYHPSQSQWSFVSDAIKNQYNKYNATNITQANRMSFHEWYRNRFASLNFYFGSLVTEITREVPAYEFWDFASDFGGNMGLFLGCSVLTLCELFDVIILTIVRWFKRKTRIMNVAGAVS